VAPRNFVVMPTGTSPCPFRLVVRVLFLFVAGLLCGCGAPVKPPRDAADEFFKLVSAQKFSAAYERSSAAFKFTRSLQYFEARARDLALTDMRAVEWGEPEQRDRLTKIRGVFTKADDTKLGLNLTLVLENGAWRLDAALSDPAPRGGVVDDVFAVATRTRDTVGLRALQFLEPSSLLVPEEREMRRIVEATLLKFNEALQNGGDFSALYEDASDRWKYRGRDPGELASAGINPRRSREADPFNHENRLTSAALRNAFEAAVRAKVDLSPIKGAKMKLRESARINSDGVLNVSGSFDCPVFHADQPDKPNTLHFALEYFMEASKWKLFGITVKILREEKRPEE